MQAQRTQQFERRLEALDRPVLVPVLTQVEYLVHHAGPREQHAHGDVAHGRLIINGFPQPVRQFSADLLGPPVDAGVRRELHQPAEDRGKTAREVLGPVAQDQRPRAGNRLPVDHF